MSSSDKETHVVVSEDPIANPPEPRVPAILKNEDGSESPNGLLPRSALSSDLMLIVPPWSFSDAPDLQDVIRVGWRLSGLPFHSVKEYTYDPPIPPGEKTVYVPMDLLDHGVYDLSYELEVGGNPETSEIKRITIDRLPPNDNQQPFALQIIGVVGDITDDYLIEHNEVRFRVTPYVGARAKDRAIYYWTTTNSPPDDEIAIGEQEFSQTDIDNGHLIITIDEATIRNSGQGPRWIYYRLRDWAGNMGQRSSLLSVYVNLSPGPGLLKPPRVPVSARGLIDRQHAREGAVDQRGVTVEIDAYANPDASDKVLISWHGIELGPLDVDPSNFPQVGYVPWNVLRQFPGPIDVRVTYKVRRGASDSPPSPGLWLTVNLTIAGPDHANAPQLLNGNLSKVDVYGAMSVTKNTLLIEDFGLDACAELALYDDPQPGQLLELYWGAIPVPVAHYRVQPGDVAGKLVRFDVPWSAIDADKDNVALPVYYTTSNGVNQQQAPHQDVRVSIIVIDDLKEPTFPHANRFGVLDCCAKPRLWEGVWVQIPAHTAFSSGDTVDVVWQGCLGENGTSFIRGARKTFSKQLNAQEALDGFQIHVDDYPGLIAPMVNKGSALVHYTLRKLSGGRGTSQPDFVIINRTMPSGDVCSPGNETCET
ncbi:hypothetical protein ACQKP7_02860 [Pseudomonas frederiksbergensis]|uniref:hypothetical protein n=1 Tax=Pseudomonas frederiksbergensis TaxID=104087 RepID=UPI003D07BF1F